MSEIKQGYKQTDIGVIPEDWELKPIGEVLKVTTGNKNTQDKEDDGLYPFFVRSQTVERINTYTFDGEGVLTAGDGVGTGKVFHYINGKFDYHQRVYLMHGFDDKVFGKYFYWFFSKYFYERINQLTAKSSVDSVRKEMIADMLMPLPKKEEQTAIATALSDTDALIATLDKKITKKQQIKQGAMQQLLTGKKRLSGFSGEWVENEFKEFCWFQEGPGLRNWQFTSSGIKVINVTNLEKGVLNLSNTARYISLAEFQSMYLHFEIEENDIVVASSGNSYGKSAIVRKRDLPLLMNTSVIRFKPKKGLDNKFLWVFINSDGLKKQIDLLITGGAQPNFGPAHLNKLKIFMPNDVTEQNQIAQILTDMDNEIAQLEKERDKYKEIKAGMMKVLLTGRIRLI